MVLTPGTRLGPYEVVTAVGAGGIGEGYRERDTTLGRDVALKVLPDAFAATPVDWRFRREAQVLASLNHPHIAAIYGFEQAPAVYPGRAAVHALALEFVEGLTLADAPARTAQFLLNGVACECITTVGDYRLFALHPQCNCFAIRVFMGCP